MKNHIMTIHENGDITTLWTDEIPLHAIGELTINRASTIEFNAETQKWEVQFTGSDAVVFSDPSRAACIAWEIETLNAQFAAGAACPIAPPMSAADHNAFPRGRWS